ncbi:hypothetical protein NIES4101_61930 [Calothrix sp. NIES-4101]|nr:hypothetical protein NIES4101_61930 [Calothrix sp. NIES-4101]
MPNWGHERRQMTEERQKAGGRRQKKRANRIPFSSVKRVKLKRT